LLHLEKARPLSRKLDLKIRLRLEDIIDPYWTKNNCPICGFPVGSCMKKDHGIPSAQYQEE
jgi:hypothetical protein